MDTLVTVSTILAVASVTECVLWMVLAIRAVREWRCALFIADDDFSYGYGDAALSTLVRR